MASDDVDLKQLMGERIAEAWEAAGFDSAADFVREAGITDYNRFKRYEAGRNLPKVTELAKIAIASKRPMEWFVFGGDPAAMFDPPDPGALAVLDQFLEEAKDEGVTDEEIATLRSVRFNGLKPTKLAYSMMWGALRACEKA